MEEKEYKCICGKVFKSQKSLSAHMASCKNYYLYRDGNLDVYNKRKLKLSKSISFKNIRKNKIRKELFLLKKQEKLEQWISEQHKCEHCGKIMTEYYGSGRFCSKSCANTRSQSQETKDKINNKLIHKKEKTYCKICNKELSYRNKSGYCSKCFPKISTEESRRKQSETMKAKKYPRWNLTRNQPSYAEVFFKTVLNNNSIVYKFNYSIKNQRHYYYYLDFYIEKNGNKLDLEIDGKQHEYEDRKQHDAERDKFLESINIIVYRIKWNEINSNKGKKLIEEKINSFLNFYNNL